MSTDIAPQQPGNTNSASAFGISNVGLKRADNQDRWADFESHWGRCLMVADGMGGHKGGERAAEILVERLPVYLREISSDQPLAKAVQSALGRVNREIYDESSRNPEVRGMGSTVVLAVLGGGQVAIAHCGDSRAYLYSRGKLVRLTQDHTVGNKMLRAGLLTTAQALEHPDSGLLTRSVGVEPELEIEISNPMPIKSGELLFLCSDGLSGHSHEQEIQRVLKRERDPEKVSKALVDLALANGGSDNVTVVAYSLGGQSRWEPRNLLSLPELSFRSSKWITIFFIAGVMALIAMGVGYEIRGTPKVFSAISQELAVRQADPQGGAVPPGQRQPQFFSVVVTSNGKPVPGAKVYFTLPKTGPRVCFGDCARHDLEETGQSDSNGLASSAEVTPGALPGPFMVHVRAELKGATGSFDLKSVNKPPDAATHANLSANSSAPTETTADATGTGIRETEAKTKPPHIMIQLLVSPKALPPEVRKWLRAWENKNSRTKDKDRRYPGFYSGPSADTIRLLQVKATKPVTIVVNPRRCTPEQLEDVRQNLKVTGEVPAIVEFHEGDKGYGVLAQALSDTGSVILLSSGASQSER